jgi:hypothetical protein
MDVISQRGSQRFEPPRARIELWTIRRERHRFQAVWPADVAAPMRPTVVQYHGPWLRGDRAPPLA